MLQVILTAALLGAGDFDIAVQSLGIGNQWRPGDVTALHATVTSRQADPIAAWLQWELPDADGDILQWGRTLTLTPTSPSSLWLYAPTRPWDDSTTDWTLRLRTYEDGQPGRTLHAVRFRPGDIGAQTIERTQSAMAILASRRLGLEQYQGSSLISALPEETRITSGISADDLPDNWPGYRSLQFMVWADAPPTLDRRTASAILAWVRLGGHLAIVLPAIGNPWSVGSPDGPMAEVLGDLHPELGGAKLRDLAGVLGRGGTWPSLDLPIHSLGDRDADWPATLHPLHSLPDGRVVAIARTVGFGTVTVIGIDIADGRLTALGLPEADIFWNRILGRRADTPSPTTFAAIENAERLSALQPTSLPLRAGEVAAHEIAMRTAAGGRLGTVLILLIAYWIMAVPVGYVILRRRRQTQWSWMWFAASAALFTVITWTIAAAAGSIRVPLRHLSIVDHIYGQKGEHVQGWFSLYMPGYASSTTSLEAGEAGLLLPWISPGSSGTPPFADSLRIDIDINTPPKSLSLPARATTVNYSYDWLGGIDPDRAGNLLRIAPDDPPVATRRSLEGSLVNHLPAALKDVTILWITDERLPRPTLFRDERGTLHPWVDDTLSGRPLNRAYIWRAAAWAAGDRLSLGAISANLQEADLARALQERYAPKGTWSIGTGTLSPRDIVRNMEALSLYAHLTPPTYQKNPDEDRSPQSSRPVRTGARGLDFAQWFARPCIIVTGFLPNSEIPIAVELDAAPVEGSSGTTMFRWVYPLESGPAQ